ncbi:T9SS type B sorting domain-containing protein [Persicobacter diffluens]
MHKCLYLIALLLVFQLPYSGKAQGDGDFEVPWPIACYIFHGNLQNDEPNKGIEDLDPLEGYGHYVALDNACITVDSAYVFQETWGLDLSNRGLPPNTYSLEMRFKFTSFSTNQKSGWRRILRFKAANASGLYLSDDGRFVFQTENNRNENTVIYGVSVIPSDPVTGETDWMRISITRDDAAQTLSVYYQGQLEFEIDLTAFNDFTAMQSSFKLFQDNTGGHVDIKDENAAGLIDYLRIYDQAFDASMHDDLDGTDWINDGDNVVINDGQPRPFYMCEGEEITLVATGGQGVYEWSTGDTTHTIVVSPVDDTWYFVDALMEVPCFRTCYTVTDSVEVLVTPLPRFEVSFPDSVCVGADVPFTYTGDQTDVAVNWTFEQGAPGSSNVFNPVVKWGAAGQYNVNLNADFLGCTSALDTTVTIVGLPSWDFEQDQGVCFGQENSWANYLGEANTVVKWYPQDGSGTEIIGREFIYAFQTPGTHTVHVELMLGECPVEGDLTFVVHEVPDFELIVPAEICSGEDLIIQLNNLTGSTDFNINWNGLNVSDLGNGSWQVHYGTHLGILPIQIEIGNSANCSISLNDQVLINESPETTIEIFEACFGESSIGNYLGQDYTAVEWRILDGPDAGTTVIGHSFDHVFSQPGSFRVQVDLSVAPCTQVLEEFFVVHPSPTFDVQAPSEICFGEDLIVQIINTSGHDFNLSWNVPVTDQSNGNYKVEYTSTGQLEIIITAGNSFACTVIDTLLVDIHPIPDIRFSGPTSTCIETAATFVYEGINNIQNTNIVWNAAGNPIMENNPAHEWHFTWDTPGDYLVQVSMEEFGCTNDSSFMVTVLPEPEISIALPDPICEGDTVTVVYTGNADPAFSSFQWQFPGAIVLGGGSPTERRVVWAQAGDYQVNLSVVMDGCENTDIFPVTVLPKPDIDFEFDEPICSGISTIFRYTGTEDLANINISLQAQNADQIIDLGNGNFEVLWATSGVFDVTMSVEMGGCTSLLTKTIVVHPTPTALTDFPSGACVEGSVLFEYIGSADLNRPGTILNYDFAASGADQVNDLGNGRFEVSWLTSGVKQIPVSVQEFGCPKDSVLNIEIFDLPLADFTAPAEVCEFSTFTATYNHTATSSLTFEWEVLAGDATITSDASASSIDLLANAAGTVTLQLKVLQENGGVLFCEQISQQDITINPTPVIDFDMEDHVCSNEPLSIRYNGSWPINDLNFEYELDGANIISDDGNGNWVIAWATPGAKLVRFRATAISSNCTSDWFEKEIGVNNISDFEINNDQAVCAGEVAHFSFSGVMEPGASLEWDFGSEAQVEEIDEWNYNVLWDTPGTKQVIVTVRGNVCPDASVVREVEVNKVPTAEWTYPEEVCRNEINIFKYSGDGDLTEVTFTADWGGGEEVAFDPATGEWSVRWADPGFYPISLTVDQGGCFSVLEDTIKVTNFAEIKVTGDPGACVGERVFVEFTGYYETGATLVWDFDGGIEEAIPGTDNYWVVWHTAGPKEVKVSIQGLNCQSDEDAVALQVGEQPQYRFEYQPVTCFGTMTHITYVDENGLNPTVDWQLDPAVGILTVINPFEVEIEWLDLSPDGVPYEVNVRIETGGCIRDEVLQIEVDEQPVADFEVQTQSCAGDEVVLTYQPAGMDVHLEWDFDGAEVVSHDAASRTYILAWDITERHDATISLRAYTDLGCEATLAKDIIIFPYPTIEIDTPNQVCENGDFDIVYRGTANPFDAEFTWDFGALVVSPGDYGPQSFKVEQVAAGIYPITLTIIENGCQVEEMTSVTVYPYPSLEFDYDPVACVGQPFYFEYTGTAEADSISWTWDIAPSETPIGDKSYEFIWDSEGTKTMSFLASSNQCVEQTFLTFEVQPHPENDVLIGEPLCEDEPFQISFTGNTDIASTLFTWSLSEGQILDNQNTSITAVNDRFGLHYVTINTNWNGCIAEDSYPYYINLQPEIALDYPQQVCLGEPFTVTYLGNADFDWNNVVYNWQLAGAEIISQSPNGHELELRFNATGRQLMNLSVEVAGQCADEQFFEIEVLPYPNIQIMSPSDACTDQEVIVSLQPYDPAFEYQWLDIGGADLWEDLGNGQFKALWLTTGQKSLQLEVNNVRCQNTVFATVNINPTPVATFDLPGGICAGEEVIVRYTGSATENAAFDWDFDGAQVRVIDAPFEYGLTWDITDGGTKTIRLQVSENGCTSEVEEQEIPVGNIASFELDTDGDFICDGEQTIVRFTGSFEPGATVIWDFDDGIVETEDNETFYIYWPTTGNKTISLTINGVLCPGAEEAKEILVNPTPLIDLDVLDPAVCVNSLARLALQLEASESAQLFWELDGGTLVQEDDQNYLIYWTSGGQKNISVYAIDEGCISEVATGTVRVNGLPDFDFTQGDQLCINEELEVIYSGVVEEGATLVWKIDGALFSPSDPERFVYSWDTPGEKTIELTVEGVTCDDETILKTVYVNPYPSRDFDIPAQACRYSTFIVTYLDNAGLKPQVDFNQPYTDLGNYQYEFEAIGENQMDIQATIIANGCQEIVDLSIQILDAPALTVDHEGIICIGEEYLIQYQTDVDPSTISWDWGNGQEVSSENGLKRVVWQSAGWQYFTAASSIGNCETVVNDSLFVIDPGTLSLEVNPMSACIEEVIEIQIIGELPDDHRILPDFGEQGQIVEHVDIGHYLVKWSTEGQKDIVINILDVPCPIAPLTAQVNINEPANANFQLDRDFACEGEQIRVQYLEPLDPDWTLQWFRDDIPFVPTAGSLTDFLLDFPEEGQFEIRLEVNNLGCISTSSRTITIGSGLEFELTDQEAICEGEIVYFKFTGWLEPQATIEWTVDGSGEIVGPNNLDSVAVRWPVAGADQWVAVELMNNTCTSDTRLQVEQEVIPFVAPVIRASNYACLNTPVTFTYEGPQVELNWEFDESAILVDQVANTITLQWETEGNKWVELVTDNGGCISDPFRKTIRIIDFDQFEIADQTACLGAPVLVTFPDLSDVPANDFHIDWAGGSVLSQPDRFSYLVFWNEAGPKNVVLTMVDLECGEGEISRQIEVMSLQYSGVDFELEEMYCFPEDVFVEPILDNPGENYHLSWFLNGKFEHEQATYQNDSLIDGDMLMVWLTPDFICNAQSPVKSPEKRINISDFAHNGPPVGLSPICPGTSTTITIDQYPNIRWEYSYNGNRWDQLPDELNDRNSITVWPGQDTYYRARIFDDYCEDITPPILIEILSITPFTTSDDIVIREGHSGQIAVFGATDVSWNPGRWVKEPNESRTSAFPVVSTDFWASGLTVEGCLDSAMVHVKVRPPVDVPNVITPNGDGKNDFLKIGNLDEYDNPVIHIYNRWGKLLHTSGANDFSWDGTHRGQPLPQATYYYVLDLNDGFPKVKGSVTILR